jgi:hypothetical protein
LSAACGFPVAALGCLVFRLGDGKLTVKEEPADVAILRAGRAAQGLRDLATGVLTPAQVDAIFEQARRSTVWVNL